MGCIVCNRFGGSFVISMMFLGFLVFCGGLIWLNFVDFYMDEIFVEGEVQVLALDREVEIGELYGENFYLYVGEEFVLSDVLINGVSCNVFGEFAGFVELNLSGCLENVSGKVNVAVVVDDYVYEDFIYLRKEVSFDEGVYGMKEIDLEDGRNLSLNVSDYDLVFE